MTLELSRFTTFQGVLKGMIKANPIQNIVSHAEAITARMDNWEKLVFSRGREKKIKA